jgi:hypothetical protein
MQGTNSTQVQDPPMEKRRAIRYRLDAPAIFSWESVEHKRLQGEGVTRDISPVDAFVITPTCPPVGTTIQFEAFLPSLTGARATTRIKGKARVLRVDPRPEKGVTGGFALLSDGFKLHPLAMDETKCDFDTVKMLLELQRSDE